MSKPIQNHFELKDICRNAGLWYLGSFMLEFIKLKELWSNPDTKSNFIQYMFNEYSGIDDDISGTTTRANAMIRIIESRKVEDALRLVLDANVQFSGGNTGYIGGTFSSLYTGGNLNDRRKL